MNTPTDTSSLPGSLQVASLREHGSRRFGELALVRYRDS